MWTAAEKATEAGIDYELYDDLQYFFFLWPTHEDAGFAAREAQINSLSYDVAGTNYLVRDRHVVIARYETEDGERARARAGPGVPGAEGACGRDLERPEVWDPVRQPEGLAGPV